MTNSLHINMDTNQSNTLNIHNEPEQQQWRPLEPPKQQQQEEQPKRKRISGAQQRKRQRLRQEMAANSATKIVSQSLYTSTMQMYQSKPHGSLGYGTTITQNKRKHCDAVPPRHSPAKRRFVEPSGSKQPAWVPSSNHLRVAVIDKQNWDNSSLGKLSANQVEELKKVLLQKLDETLFEGNSNPPTFKSWTHTHESLRIVCETEASLDWLKETVKRLPPLWEGAKLEVVPYDQLPRLTKVTLWVPGKDVVLFVLCGMVRLKRFLCGAVGYE